MTRRRALTNVSGRLRSSGDKLSARWLTEAMAAAEQAPPDEHVHGFHAYPARMHPALARTVLAAIGGRGPVLDPFCGSGTTLVEARLAARPALGVDLNPLGIRLARLKAAPPPAAAWSELTDAAAAVVEGSIERVKARTRIRAPLQKRDVELYAPHVLLELAGLLVELRAVDEGWVRDALEMVFSSMVTKFSRLEGETAGRTREKTIGRFVPSRFFLRKAQELVERWGAYAALLPPDVDALAPVRIHEGDARELKAVLQGPVLEGLPAIEPAVALSSPPYGGTYDYRAHHRLRASWLGLDDERFEAKELGARRRLSRSPKGKKRWDSELGMFLQSLAAVLPVGAPAVLLLGDAEVGGERVPADAQLARLGPPRGFVVEAAASQSRPDWRRGPEREEHLVLLRRSVPTASSERAP